ncbi:MAG: hypothetical protein PHF79_02595, partial [Candidatus Pacebacteria bacterium]|nr:hypothetical protein [Candidatus Paceibacterota bacterium]
MANSSNKKTKKKQQRKKQVLSLAIKICLGSVAGFAAIYFISSTHFFSWEYDRAAEALAVATLANASSSTSTSGTVSTQVPIVEAFNKVAYDQKMIEIANYGTSTVASTSGSTLSGTST